MATLYDRVASRGFAGGTVAGKTGAGALESQGGPQNPRHSRTVAFDPPQNLPLVGADQEPVAPVAVLILDGQWGLSGSVDLDPAPRNHTAPGIGWTGNDNGGPERAELRAYADEVHAVDYGAPVRRREQYESAIEHADHWENLNRGESLLQPVPDQMRGQGGRDEDQGFSRRNGYDFDAGHRSRTTLSAPIVNAYLEPAERAWVVATAHGTFIPTDAVQGPLVGTSYLNAPSINAVPQTSYTPPPEPVTSPEAPVGAPASAGWFS
jgi:hypothetical protein